MPLILIFSYISFLIKPEYGFLGVGTTTWLALSRRKRNGGEAAGAMGCYPRLLNSMTSVGEGRSEKSHRNPMRLVRFVFYVREPSHRTLYRGRAQGHCAALMLIVV
jgi:hypothetical protein